jgi:CheY-like chemotaxis protein
MRVFVVDDEASARSLLPELTEGIPSLEWAGEAASAEEALAGVVAARPEVVVMDYRLPGMDGVAATAWLRSTHPEVDVVAWTGSYEGTVRDAFLAAGASAVFTKPQVSALIRELARRAGA